MTPIERPKSWANWRAHDLGAGANSAEEFDLYSDSVIHGIPHEFGPYRLMNLIAGERRETRLARPVMAMRIRYAASPNPMDEDAEHGGRHPDEVAALISLVLGIRLQAGGKTRYFDFVHHDDRLGKPRAQAEAETPVLLPGAWTEIIGHARRTADLDTLTLLTTYPALTAAAATALMRAARLYQEALWLSERESWLTWLLLVSAVETVANEHQYPAEVPPSELLRELDPRLARACAPYGEECVAATQVKVLGATKKFLGFLRTFLPEPPPVRPSAFQIDWSWESLEAPLKQVYQMRSEYLHAGVPFPWELRAAPEPRGDAPVEVYPRPLGEAKAHIHLHVFEYVVRGAILRWWTSLTQSSGVTPP